MEEKEMGTGKELARMMECGIWEDYVKPRKDFISAQIFDDNNKRISLEEAKGKVFCSAKILFKKCPEGELKLLSCILQMVASTGSESMCIGIKKRYGTQQIEIS